MKRKNKNTKTEKNFKEKIKKGLITEEKDIKDIWRRIRKRDFSGNTGLIIKNSLYQTLTNIVAKGGSFIFVVILARLLMPKMFGLYSLALSTILIFGVFSELGIGIALVRFISKELGKKGKKIKPYLLYFGKIRIFLLLLISIILLVSANYLANNFYQKPIFLALIAGVLYTIFNQISGFLKGMIQAANYFPSIFKREIIFQVSRIILVPLAVIFAIKYSLSDEINLMLIILFLSFSLFLASLFLFFDARKIYLKKLGADKKTRLPKKQKIIANKFLIATAALILSGVFFGNIDKVMLGRFVESAFIGYYTAAFSLVGALIALIGGASIALLPIFSRLKGKRLEQGFKKSIRIILIFSLVMFLGTIFLAHFVILIVYGKAYLSSVNILRALSLLLLIIPILSIYQSYFISQGRPQIIAKLLVSVTILNVLLNYFLITAMLSYGEIMAVYGAVTATLISQFSYLGGMILWKRKYRQ